MHKITKTEKNFKRKLAKLREENGYSKYYVAKQCHINYSYYHRLEDPDTGVNLGFEMMERIAGFYHIEVYELFSGEDTI